MRLFVAAIAFLVTFSWAMARAKSARKEPSHSARKTKDRKRAKPKPRAHASAPKPCKLGPRPKLFLFYAGVGRARAADLLAGCHGEVVVGEKHEAPHGPFKSEEMHKRGGRTAYVFSNFGKEIRELLLAPDGVAKAERRIERMLKAGHDYVVIDEITAHPDWADGSTVNRRFRKLLARVPARKVIAYVSIDLTQYPGGGARMRARGQLLRALQKRGRAIALEVYLHTRDVIAGAAPRVFREAADRLANAVGGHHINRRAITVIGLTLHSTAGSRYEYLNGSRADLSSIHRQIEAIRGGTSRLREQRGHGFYHSGIDHITPRPGGPYTLDQLIDTVVWSLRK